MLWLITSLIVLITILIIFNKWTKDEGFEKIQGPAGVFLLENALDFVMDPVKLFYYFRFLTSKYKRLFKLKLGSKKVLILYNPEDVELLISNSKYNTKGFLYDFIEPWLKEGLLLSDGQKWHQRRKILTPTFHFNMLRNFRLVLQENSNRFVKQLEGEVGQPKTDLAQYITDFTLHSICETAMGTKLDEVTTDFGRTYKNGIFQFGESVVYRAQRVWLYAKVMFSLSYIGQKQKDTITLLSSFRDNVIDKRRSSNKFAKCLENIDDEKEDDVNPTRNRLAMLDLLLKAEREGTIDAQGVAEEVDTFMFEGHDTTATALKFAFMLLANNPESQDNIISEWKRVVGSSTNNITMSDLAELKYLESCIKESLRLYPPVFFFTRNVKEPLKMTNHEIAPGTECSVLVFDLHRLADQFVEPLEFRPERFLKEPTWHPYSYIPFSAGPRNCIGQKFAMMELKLAIASVVLQYRLLPVTTPHDIVFITDFILRPKNPIYVKLEKRN